MDDGQVQDTGAGVVDRAVAGIRARIAAGDWPPGHRLVEPDLTAELRVSRTALREALHQLASEGTVTLSRFRGASVRRLDRAQLEELFAARAVLEGVAARRAAPEIAASEETRAGLQAIMGDLERAVGLDDASRAYSAANARLHGFILARAGGSLLSRLVPPLQLPLHRLALGRMLDPAARTASQAGHRVIAAALLAGDGISAEAAMRVHVEQSGAAILSLADAVE